MVEIFRTNVEDPLHAHQLIEEIHRTFCDYIVNFDLDDCDRVLRVKCSSGTVQCASLISLLKRFGVDAEVLPDELPI